MWRLAVLNEVLCAVAGCRRLHISFTIDLGSGNRASLSYAVVAVACLALYIVAGAGSSGQLETQKVA